MSTFTLKNESVLAEIRSLVEDIERDTVLYAEGASFRVHKLLLFAASTRFKEILRCVCKESFFFVFMQHDADTVECLVHLLYRGRVEIVGSANTFISFANFLNIEVVAGENPDKEKEFEMLNSSADLSPLSIIKQATDKESTEYFIPITIPAEKETVEPRAPSESKFSEQVLPETFEKCEQPIGMKTSTPYLCSSLGVRNSRRLHKISSCRLTFQRKFSHRKAPLNVEGAKLFGIKRSCTKKPPTAKSYSFRYPNLRSADANIIKALAEEIKVYAAKDNFMPDNIDQLDLMIH